MSPLVFSQEKTAPDDLLVRPPTGTQAKYIELLNFIGKEAKVGEWIKVTVSEENPEQLKKTIHSLQNTIRSWRKKMAKSGKALIELSQFRKILSANEAEVWIRIDKYQKN